MTWIAHGSSTGIAEPPSRTQRACDSARICATGTTKAGTATTGTATPGTATTGATTTGTTTPGTATTGTATAIRQLGQGGDGRTWSAL